jgi:armadillo repeat-containing protein 8
LFLSFDVDLADILIPGSHEALRSLLQANAPQAFLYAISNFQPTDSVLLRSAFARALRALTVAIADAVGPSQWGLRTECPDIRNEAKAALDYLFQVR